MLICCRRNTLQIWLYRECYFRISSREFSMDDLREVIHLTNFTVQKRYSTKLDPRMPQNNMWSLDQFKQYLKEQYLRHSSANVEQLWQNQIFSGFRKNLIAVVLASLDDTELRENCFELFGCDFMLAEDLTPILIEINATPDLSPSTEITARLCPRMLEDLVKVVVDGSRLHNSIVGDFELVYEVDWKHRPAADAREVLNIRGSVKEIHKAPKTLGITKRLKAVVHPKRRRTNVINCVQLICNESAAAQVVANDLPKTKKRNYVCFLC